MSLLQELFGMSKSEALAKSRKRNVRENDYMMGGTRSMPGPDTTDGPYNPEMNTYGDEESYGDYQDFGDMESGEADDMEGGEGLEGEDIVSMDVPLVIRMMEWAKEEAPDDIALHKAVDNMLDLAMERGTADLTMDDYEDIIEGCCDSETEDGELDDESGDEFDFSTSEDESGETNEDEFGGETDKMPRPGMEDMESCGSSNPRVSRMRSY